MKLIMSQAESSANDAFFLVLVVIWFLAFAIAIGVVWVKIGEYRKARRKGLFAYRLWVDVFAERHDDIVVEEARLSARRAIKVWLAAWSGGFAVIMSLTILFNLVFPDS
jgi:hypothetical protein